MKVAISMIVTCNQRIDRKELIESLQKKGHTVVYIGKESTEKINNDYNKLNVEFLSFPVGRSNTNPFQELKSFFKLRKLIKENSIESLVVYGIRTFPIMVLAAKLAGVNKIVCVVNGSGRLFQLTGLRGSLIKSISYPMIWTSFLLTNKVFFQNSDDMKMLSKKKLLPKRNYSLINGSGVNLSEYKSNRLEERPVFTMISRLTGSKGVNEFIEAAFIVKKKYSEAQFNLIGPMDNVDFSIDFEKLKKAASDGVVTINDKVNDVRPFIEESRVFVLPSYYPEGVPRAILEAMAMERPIITTDSPGCRETVVDNENGFLIPPRDSQGLSEKMIWFIENPNETNEMAKESRRIAELKFDVHKINKKIIQSLSI